MRGLYFSMEYVRHLPEIAMAGTTVAEQLPRTAAKQLFEILSLLSLR